jgi:FMN-dependent NADH-azoreductase
MKKILHIKSSLNGDHSFSTRLGKAIIENLKQHYPGVHLVERDLVKQKFPHFELESHKDGDDEVIREVFNADIIVIGAPLYNFGIPSQLKAWIDHISKAGVTFSYDKNGPKGLVAGKKVYVAMSSGGIYSEGPSEDFDFVSPYLKSVLGFLGMTDVEIIRVEGTSMSGVREYALEKAIDSLEQEILN